MREVYVAAYERIGERWRVRRSTPAVLRPDDVRAAGGAGWHGEGDGFAAYPQLADRSRGSAAWTARRFPKRVRSASSHCRELAAGRGVAAADALPLYVRHRVALTSAERAAGARL